MPRHALGAQSKTGRATIARTVAALLAVLGVTLVIVGACSSRSGPPQPSAGAGIETAAMTSTAASSPAGSPTTSGSGSAASTTAAATALADRAPSSVTSPTIGSSAPAPATAAARTTAAPPSRSTGPIPQPTNTVAVPSFAAAVAGPILPSSKPTKLTIPTLGVTSPVLDLGLLPDGTIATPSLDDPQSKAGWYTGSPTPGAQGPSIILGHVDSRKYGPGVFYDLGKLQRGNTIEVARADGTVAVFKVDYVRSFPKAAFPTEEIYGNLDHSGLRLITCGGTFDPAKRSYESNIIAFASLVSSRKS